MDLQALFCSSEHTKIKALRYLTRNTLILISHTHSYPGLTNEWDLTCASWDYALLSKLPAMWAFFLLFLVSQPCVLNNVVFYVFGEGIQVIEVTLFMEQEALKLKIL